jgi:uncharacterized protein YdaL
MVLRQPLFDAAHQALAHVIFERMIWDQLGLNPVRLWFVSPSMAPVLRPAAGVRPGTLAVENQGHCQQKVLSVLCTFALASVRGQGQAEQIARRVSGYRTPGIKWLLALVISTGLVLGAQVVAVSLPTSIGAAVLPDLTDHKWPDCALGAPRAQSIDRRRTLILHDRGNVGSDAGAAYATLMANLASHFGPVKVARAASYRPGDMLSHDLLVYVGTGYGEKLPNALLRDVNSGDRPVLWLKQNIDQLAPEETFYRTYGWLWNDFDGPSRFEIRYKRARLEPSDAGAGLTTVSKLDRNRVRVLATAEAAGKSFPLALHSKQLTYIADLPLGSNLTQDASLALTDLLHDLVPGADPAILDRRRALVRIEDIGPMSDPDHLKDIAEAMKDQGVPYSIAVYPVYVGPIIRGRQKTVRLADRPEVVRAIVEMLDGGATLVSHGYSHQFGNRKNPLSGESGADYEFFLAHLDARGNVVYEGTVPGDSEGWAENRIDQALEELRLAGLPKPRIFNVPHYAASPADYAAISSRFPARYDRGTYFAPDWNGSAAPSAYMSEQAAPYLIRDSYGSLVVPENLGYVSDPSRNTSGPNTKSDVLAGAAVLLSVRDSVASFFYHPFLGSGNLLDIVGEMRRMGYTFVSPCEL